MRDREAQRERDHAVDDVPKPQHGEEPCLPRGERDTLRHFLGLLLEADEPEAMVASLRRLAERKAWYAVRGALVDRQAAQRWLALAEALAKVERQVTPQRSSPATETFAD